MRLRAGARADEGEWSSNSGAQRPTSWLARAEEAETDQNGETGERERERTRVPLIRVSWPARRLEVRGGRLLRQSIYFLRRGAHGRAVYIIEGHVRADLSGSRGTHGTGTTTLYRSAWPASVPVAPSI